MRLYTDECISMALWKKNLGSSLCRIVKNRYHPPHPYHRFLKFSRFVPFVVWLAIRSEQVGFRKLLWGVC